jgi:hypothetical protein
VHRLKLKQQFLELFQFRKLVKESLVQNETFNLIKNVQLAIKSTNVIPNIAISPDMQLVPDNLIILNNPKFAYKDLVHNTIKGMHFGLNNVENNLLYKKHFTHLSGESGSVRASLVTGGPTSVNTQALKKAKDESVKATKSLNTVRKPIKVNPIPEAVVFGSSAFVGLGLVKAIK